MFDHTTGNGDGFVEKGHAFGAKFRHPRLNILHPERNVSQSLGIRQGISREGSANRSMVMQEFESWLAPGSDDKDDIRVDAFKSHHGLDPFTLEMSALHFPKSENAAVKIERSFQV